MASASEECVVCGREEDSVAGGDWEDCRGCFVRRPTPGRPDVRHQGNRLHRSRARVVRLRDGNDQERYAEEGSWAEVVNKIPPPADDLISRILILEPRHATPSTPAAGLVGNASGFPLGCPGQALAIQVPGRSSPAVSRGAGGVRCDPSTDRRGFADSLAEPSGAPRSLNGINAARRSATCRVAGGGDFGDSRSGFRFDDAATPPVTAAGR